MSVDPQMQGNLVNILSTLEKKLEQASVVWQIND